MEHEYLGLPDERLGQCGDQLMDGALDDAAAAALYALAHLPVEHMGALYGKDLKRSNLVSMNDASHVKGTLQVPRAEMRALFHNHPLRKRDRDREYFSDDDKGLARRLNLPSYISAGDRIRRFDPNKNQTADVLHQLPIDEIKKSIAQKIINSRLGQEVKLQLLRNLMVPELTSGN